MRRRLPNADPWLFLALLSWSLGACAEETAGAAGDASVVQDAAFDAALDSGAPDASSTVDAALDASTDASLDAASDAATDAGSDASTVPTLPMLLSETGLYVDGSTSELAEGVMPYEPRYELWSDGADKARWLYLPEGETIDTTDMDAFVFPVGTKAWKEFSLEVDGTRTRLETRLLWKTSMGWVQLAFAWNEAQDDAVATTRGAEDVLGTEHDIPQRIECRECHEGAADTLLGVSAVQLAHDRGGLTLAQLDASGRLSSAPPPDIARPDTLEWNALGYLHANCGTCHNPIGKAFERVELDLWLRVAELDAVTSTQTYLTTVDVPLEQTATDVILRVAPGAADESGLITRMTVRGEENAMPPIASERIDDDGIQLISDWIDSL